MLIHYPCYILLNLASEFITQQTLSPIYFWNIASFIENYVWLAQVGFRTIHQNYVNILEGFSLASDMVV